ncbi:MAG: DNA polymerase III subunit gamma/tau, partial [Pseudonocardia sp.]
VHTGLTEMRGATAPRLLLELLCARMLLPAASISEPGLLERLERMERRIAVASPPAGADVVRAVDADVLPAAGAGTTPIADADAPQPMAGAVTAPMAGRTGATEGGRTFTRASSPDAVNTNAAAGSAKAPAAGDRTTGTARHGTGVEPQRSSRSAESGEPTLPAGETGAGPSPAAPHEPELPVPNGRPVVPPVSEPASPVGGILDAAAVRRVWPEVLSEAKERKKRTAALLVSATVRAVEDDTLVLSIGTAPLARLLSEQSNTEVIADSLHAVLGVRWRIHCEHGDAAAPPVRSADPAQPPAAPQPGTPRRPARPAPTRKPPTRRSAAADGVPLPAEPADEEAPPEDEESMIAEMATDASVEPVARRDPEEAAIELLTSQLGARAIDRR